MRVITRESQANRAAGRRGIHQHTAARDAQAVLLCQSLRHLPDAVSYTHLTLPTIYSV